MSKRLLLLILLPLAILLVALSVWRWLAGRPAPFTDAGAPGSELAGAPGVNLDASELTAERLPETLRGLDAAGLRWVRFTLSWEQIESRRGQPDWRQADRVFASLAAHPKIIPLIVLDESPVWARRPGDGANRLAPPQERAHFGTFAREVAERFGSQARYYQVWHEPNIAPHWGARFVDPTDYAGLLREAAIQIRAVDPDAVIVLAALAPNIEAGGANLSDIGFLDALYAAGAGPWFDVVAAEPYGFSAPPDAPADPSALNFGRVTLLREVMVRRGDGAKRIFATAFGWNAHPAGGPLPVPTGHGPVPTGQGPVAWGLVDEAAQVAYAGQARRLAGTRWQWLGPLFWAANCPQRLADDPWLGFRLCADQVAGQPSGAQRPVSAALTAALPPILGPGDHATDHPALRYTPGWRVTSQAADPSADGDTLELQFEGSGLALRLQGGPYWAYYRVTVDGQPAPLLPRDESGTAYLILYDPASSLRTVALARGLSPGRHTARIEAVGGWGQWAVRGVRIEAESPASPVAIIPWWALLLGAAAAVGLWVWLAAQRMPRHPAGDAAPASDGWRYGSAVLSALRVCAAGITDRLDRVARLPDWLWWLGAAGLTALLVVSTRLPLDALLLLVLGLLFLIRPDAALPVLAFVIPFWPRPKAFGGLSFSLFEMLLWLAVAAVAVRCILESLRTPTAVPGASARGPARAGARWGLRGLDWPVLALFGVGLLATLAAEHREVAVRELRTVFVTGLLFYALVSRVGLPARRAVHVKAVVVGLLLGMAFVSAVALWQLVTGQGRIDVEGVGRVRAFYGSPNNLALVLDRAAPLALALAAFGWFERRTGWRLVFGIASALLIVACVATFSKGALLLGLPVGVAVVLLGGAWRGRVRWPLWLLAATFLASGAGLALLIGTPRFADLTNLGSGTSFFRLKLWASALRMAADHPWLGVGPDNFLYAYRSVYVLPSAWQELNLSHPHNLILDLATRLGAPGLLAGVWAVGAGLAAAGRCLRDAGGEHWPLGLGLLAGLLATIAHGLIDNSIFLIDLTALFMLALGLLQRLSDSRGIASESNGVT